MFRSGKAVTKFILFIAVLILSLILTNFGFGFFLSSQQKYYVWPPHLRKVFKPVPRFLPGVQGISRFSINSAGIRGEEFSSSQAYRILSMGGSTTECLYLDQNKSWPEILRRKLNALGSGEVWVGNVGKSGMTSRDHLVQMKYLLPQYPKIDLIVLLVGINDFMMASCDAHYDPNFWSKPGAEEEQISHAFSICPFDNRHSLYTGIGTLRLLNELKRLFSRDAIRQDETGEIYETLRTRRKNARTLVAKLPELTLALDEYQKNLNRIVDFANTRSLRLILMTQPSLWKEHMRPQEQALLWKGRKEGEVFTASLARGDYYSIPALQIGMRRFNEALLETCRKRNIECIDLAGEIPKNAGMFYDDVHFNEGGAKKVAEVLYNYLVATTPLFHPLSRKAL